MRIRWSVMLAAGVMTVVACAIGAVETSPTTAPTQASSTQPAGFRVRGKVSVSGGFLSQKPDLTRVVVYLASDPALDRAGATTRATVSQHNKAFTPNFLVVERGTEVEFPNWDKFDHNVFSRSAAAPAFDLDRYPYGKSKTRTFDKLGVVQVFCNIHPQMRAVIYVTPNRFFTRADAEGNFAIDGIPAGTYELVAWNERCEEVRQTIDVKEGGVDGVAMQLNETRSRVVNSADAKARGSYGGVEKGLGVKREKLNLPVVTEAHDAPEESKP